MCIVLPHIALTRFLEEISLVLPTKLFVILSRYSRDKI
jgi:hypothetical protein